MSLKEEVYEELLQEEPLPKQALQRKRVRFSRAGWLSVACVSTALSIGLNLLLAFAVVALIFFESGCRDPSLSLFSPAEGFVRYFVAHPEDSVHYKNEYMNLHPDGSPNHDVHERWMALYSPYMDTAIPSSEGIKLGDKSVRIPGSDDYLVELEVFHQLHCLDAIRRSLFPAEGHTSGVSLNVSDGDMGAHQPKHLDHCLDWIRQALMCWVDITPVSWQLDPDLGYPETQIPHQRTCRDWSRVIEWAEAHRVPHVDFQGLVEKGIGQGHHHHN